MMKYFCGVLLTLLVGYGQGQTFTMDAAPAKPPNGSLLVLRTSGSVAVPDCDESVTFHGKQKAIKDIWPEECREVVTSGTSKMPNMQLCVNCEWPKLEPPDVPAIEGEHQEASVCSDSTIKGLPSGKKWCTDTTYGCADKSRILLTAENGEKWCHKPESSPKP
jgi:hypothetical protein